MTERVTVEGRGLAVTVEEADDPKRRRPKTYTPPCEAVRSKAGRTLEQIIAEPNPYWDDDGNPIEIMQDTAGYPREET